MRGAQLRPRGTARSHDVGNAVRVSLERAAGAAARFGAAPALLDDNPTRIAGEPLSRHNPAT